MAYDNLSPCAADALRSIRQVKINGIMTGFNGLDECIAAVREENHTSENAIRASLMNRTGYPITFPRVPKRCMQRH